MKMKTTYGSAIGTVRELASRQIGVSLREAAIAIDRNLNDASVHITNMVRSGEVSKAGVHLAYRYFTCAEAAAAFDVKSKADHIAKLGESRIRRLEKKALRERLRRAAVKAAKPPKAAKEVKTKQTRSEERLQKILEKKPKCQNIVIESKQQSIDKVRVHQKAEITWPAHVKIQRVSGYVGDTRYKVDPKHVGSFSQEWQQLRAA